MWTLPIGLLAAIWLGIAWLHVGGVGLPDREGLREAHFQPLDPETAGRVVTLPHDWGVRDARTAAARYRLTLELQERPAGSLDVYLPDVNAPVRVLVNGTEVESGARVRVMTSPYWHVPAYVAVPGTLWRAGENEITVEARIADVGTGYLGPVYVGTESELAAAFEARRALQIRSIEGLVVITLWFAAISALVWLRRRNDSLYLWFSVTLVVFGVGFWNLLAWQSWLPGSSWLWLWLTVLTWLVVLSIVFTHRLLALERPSLERGVAAAGAIATLFFLAVEGHPTLVDGHATLRWARTGWVVLVLMAGAYPPALLMRALVRQPTRELQVIVTAPLAIIVGGFHDMAMIFTPLSRTHALAIPWTAAATVAVFAWVLVNRFITALDTSEALTAELEDRVARKAAELDESYASLRELEQERAVAQERERLMAEIHDGIGGQLVSTLAMIQSGEAPAEAVEGALRAALDDMRLVIHSLDADAADVPTLLGILRARIGPRLESSGVELRWQVEDLPPVRDFGPEAALHVMRILQEAITNVVKHAGARTLTVGTRVEDGSILVWLSDDGVGLGQGPRPGEGLGLGNMARRARALGGELTIGPGADGSGTEVRLVLPRA